MHVYICMYTYVINYTCSHRKTQLTLLLHAYICSYVHILIHMHTCLMSSYFISRLNKYKGSGNLSNSKQQATSPPQASRALQISSCRNVSHIVQYCSNKCFTTSIIGKNCQIQQFICQQQPISSPVKQYTAAGNQT